MNHTGLLFLLALSSAVMVAHGGQLVVPSSAVSSGGAGARVLPVASEGAACTASPTANAAITADYRHILSCQSGTWRRTTGRYWRDPVANQAALPSSGNEIGDVRLTLDTGRIYTWNGSAWNTLSVQAINSTPRLAPNAVHLQWKTYGTYTWTVPAGVNQIEVIIAGGSGGAGGGGDGRCDYYAIAQGGPGLVVNKVISVTPGSTLTLIVGQKGYDGGTNMPPFGYGGWPDGGHGAAARTHTAWPGRFAGSGSYFGGGGGGADISGVYGGGGGGGGSRIQDSLGNVLIAACGGGGGGGDGCVGYGGGGGGGGVGGAGAPRGGCGGGGFWGGKGSAICGFPAETGYINSPGEMNGASGGVGYYNCYSFSAGGLPFKGCNASGGFTFSGNAGPLCANFKPTGMNRGDGFIEIYYVPPG